ncbi:choline/carnitine O-acyltransferase [Pseudofrankia sp. BMG5.37]|uniref:choline/carnitine O-acyltransferase n=1 Tax=Pseudofrankia sp. BMG5.37 TaxID=3050035 RepID=UPI0028938679|nr:choline/carnitine O-acyltransferase [Pseudofrankia sp. BMG5.37]MDT3443178.1 choline/carnitine O-acyltransferase [Pseudofrankia sp. BMG5.37]
MTVQTGREAATTAAAPTNAGPSTNAAPSTTETVPAVRTFDNEESLPRVPLPDLADSCARFLDWCAPLLTTEQLAATEAAVNDFLAPDGPGRPLHAELARFNASDGVHSWLDEFWPARYLGRRDRIALNANFFFLFRDAVPPPATPTPPGGPQAERAAGLIAAALDYKIRLDAESIPPLLRRGQPQSMVQNRFLFSTTRIPGQGQDTVRVPYSAAWPGPSDARHVVVFRHGQMFRMDVLGPDGTPHTLPELAAGLAAVLAAAGPAPAPDDVAVGHLTTKARAAWAESRAELLAHDPANAAALDEIERALFCVCLDHVVPPDTLATCDQLLYGSAAGRWYDKSVSFVVFPNGRAGINIEHCGLDGTTVLSFVDELLAAPPAELSARSGARAHGRPAVRPVSFVLDATLRADVQAAAESFAEFGEETVAVTLSFPEHGADRSKTLRISPDALVQLAYQLAHYRARGRTGATYESIATRQWRYGRTEAMRVVTPEVLTFVATMDDPAADPATRRAALRAAADAHVRRAGECQRGDAPEQHLWELAFIQRRRGAELGVPTSSPLYESPGWLVMRDDYLSTSSAPSANIEHFGFGSTSGKCIGIAYVLLPDRLNIYLSTPRPVAAGMHAFADRLRDALGELDDLLTLDPAGS